MVNQDVIDESVKVLSQGGVVIFPADTVWGIGVAINQMNALSRLYEIKGRSSDKPTAVLVNGLPMAMKLGAFSHKALELARRHWPGGLTIVVRARRGAVPQIVQAGKGTVGLRVPKHELTLKIITRLGAGIVAGSANFAGAEAPRRFGMIDQKLLDAVDYVVKAPLETVTEVEKLMPSTVIDTTKSPFEILRQGGVKINTNNYR
jgi:L-threonylcarbamoyladenylate synthase